MKILFTLTLLLSFFAGLSAPCASAEATIIIETGKPAGSVSPLLYGLMTEEINHCYDGGLYAELIQNRAFLDDPKLPVHWSLFAPEGAAASIRLDDGAPLNAALPVSLRLETAGASPASPASLANEGFWGVPAYSKTSYTGSFYAKAAPGFQGTITVSIQSEDGKTVYAKHVVKNIGREWKQYEVTLKTGKLTLPVKARCVLAVDQPGTVWFNLVSLFPPTWNDRPNGLRRDLMQKLVDLKPQFLRFPGGNYLEGDTVATRFDWKKTLGPLRERPGHDAPWKYRSSDGMGLMEFLLWCEDLGAEPVLGVYAGYSFKEPAITPGPELEPFVQDALDEIDYITGPVTSKWGALRARDGHPKPFNLRYVEIGNEDFFDRSGSYDGRFAQIFDAIKKRYPEIQCISSIGVSDKPVKGLLSARKPDLMDIHFYRSTAEFLKKIAEFDTRFDRKGPKVIIGEWAAHEDPKIKPWSKEAHSQAPTPSMKAAIGDAACMAAMERNADIIAMHCYAPLFANVNPDAWQWRPSLIGYDALTSFGSPSYYAFSMFSNHVGDQILALATTGTPVQCSATRESKTRQIFLKLVNPEASAQVLKIELAGADSIAPTATAITLAANPEDTNSLEEPTKIVPKTSTVDDIKPTFSYTVPAHGIVVLTLKPR
jgi:alpha-N-arabinofuranosidase